MRRGKHLSNTFQPDILIDWKSNPEQVMEEVNHVLKQYGLEVLQNETNMTDYGFSIVRRKTVITTPAK